MSSTDEDLLSLRDVISRLRALTSAVEEGRADQRTLKAIVDNIDALHVLLDPLENKTRNVTQGSEFTDNLLDAVIGGLAGMLEQGDKLVTSAESLLATSDESLQHQRNTSAGLTELHRSSQAFASKADIIISKLDQIIETKEREAATDEKRLEAEGARYIDSKKFHRRWTLIGGIVIAAPVAIVAAFVAGLMVDSCTDNASRDRYETRVLDGGEGAERRPDASLRSPVDAGRLVRAPEPLPRRIDSGPPRILDSPLADAGRPHTGRARRGTMIRDSGPPRRVDAAPRDGSAATLAAVVWRGRYQGAQQREQDASLDEEAGMPGIFAAQYHMATVLRQSLDTRDQDSICRTTAEALRAFFVKDCEYIDPRATRMNAETLRVSLEFCGGDNEVLRRADRNRQARGCH